MAKPRQTRRTDGSRWSHERRGEARFNTPRDTPHIFGLHAVAAAIANAARTIHRLCLTENAERRLVDTLKDRKLTIERVKPKDLDALLGPDTVHQGAYAEVSLLPETTLDEIVARIADHGPIVVLDQVTDPHNVGAVLRSAAVFGSAGLVITRRHAPPLYGALAKSASGALEMIPIAQVQNLARALEDLGAAGVKRIGLDGESSTALDRVTTTAPVALVLGSEGKGLRVSTKAACDVLAAIATTGPITSLNVSNAAAIALHLAAMERTGTR